MRKIVSVSLAIVASMAFSAKAQDCAFYFPQKKGAVAEMKSYNEKDKLTSSSKSTVTESTATSIKFNSESFDAKGKSVGKGDFEVKCENGEFVVDMKQYLKGVDLNAYQGMDVKIDAKNMSIPAKLEVGKKLNDGEINMKISNQFMTIMNMTIKITDRTVESIESITVPAGTYKCAKISYNVESKFMGTTKTKGIDYISEKVGVVRNESFDSKGKPAGYTVLTALTE